MDDQFAIGSVTKSVVAAQLIQLVEAGELSLDDLAADHLPADLDFDTNGATIRQLLSHHSGLKDSDKFPSIASATGGGPAAAMASDSPSWRVGGERSALARSFPRSR